MADILASVSVVLGAEMSGFQAAMSRARNELRGLVKFAEGMKDVGESLSKYVTLPIIGVGGAAVKMAGDMEKAKVSFTTMLGSAEAATQTLGELKDFAADTPFEFPEIQEAAKKLLAFNTPAKDLKETLRQLGDISAGVDAPLSEIAEIFGKARVQGRLFAEDINQLTGRGIPVIQEFAKQFGVTDAEVKKLVEGGKIGFPQLQQAFADLTKEGAKFGGLMAAQSQTLPGLFSTLTDTIGQAAADIGTDIVESLNLKGALQGVSDFVKRAADAFRDLSPEVKKAIIVGAALAAALGPVLVVIGSIGAALPAIAGGFALFTGPVGLAAAAVAALGVGIAAYVATSKTATQEFEEQKQKVAGLQTGLAPLLDRYDQLKNKTSLSKAEQEELRAIIQKVGEQIPTAITAFDNYGRAIDVSTEAGRRFIEQEKRALTQRNKGALNEQRAEYVRLTEEINETTKALNKRNAAGEIVRTDVGFGQAGALELALTGEEVQALQDKLANLRDGRKNVGALIDSLKGITPATTDANKGIGSTTVKVAGLSEEIKKVPERVEGMARRVVAAFESIGTAPEFELQLPEFKGVPEFVEGVKGFGDASDNIGDIIKRNQDRIKQYMGEFKNPLKQLTDEQLAAITDFNVRAEIAVKQMNEIISSGIANVIGSISGAIGRAAAGAEGFGEAISNALLGAVGAMLIQLGQLAITTGVVMEAIKKAFTNPYLAVAAGAAAIALGSYVSSKAQSITGSIGGGAGGGIGAVSNPRSNNFNPTTAPGALASGQGSVTRFIVDMRADGSDLAGVLDLQFDRFGRVVGRR